MTLQKFWKPLLATPVLLGFLTVSTAIAGSSAANSTEIPQLADASTAPTDAAPLPQAKPMMADASTASLAQAGAYAAGESEDEADQVTSVSQLTDVRPTDWAFQALQSLVERYGCIVGYPDKNFRGNRALTRYEFAAGVNACLDRINELIAAGTADLARKEDLLVLQRLQEEFAAELATIRGRVDALEVRTATLEKQQFSTTTKLSGEVIFSIADTFGDRAVVNGAGNRFTTAARDDGTETIFSDRVRIALDTSFTGKDRLRTRLQARNTTPFSGAFTGTNETRLGFDGDEGNAVRIDKLNYRFNLSSSLAIQVDAVNLELYESLISPLTPFASSSTGSVSRFGRFSPIYRENNPTLVPGGAGLTFAYKFSNQLRLEGGYVGDTRSNDPAVKNGLFNGSYTALGQLVFEPNPGLQFGLTYAHSYYPSNPGTSGIDAVNITASTGNAFAAAPFGNTATSVDAVGGSVQLRLSPKFIVGGQAAGFLAHRRSNGDNATVFSASAYLAFPDLGKKGNLAAILAGIPPKLVENEGLTNAREDADTPIHVEAFYRYQLTDNIAITPGFFVIFNPEGNSNNDTQYVGVLRTTFSF